MSMTQRSRGTLIQWMIGCFLLITWAQSASANLNIEITQGRDNAVSIAVVPFLWQGGGRLSTDIAKVVGSDLDRSGQFQSFDRNNMLALPANASEVVYSDWSRQKVEYLLIGRISRSVSDANQYVVSYNLFSVTGQRSLFKGSVTGSAKQMRAMAHHVADKVYEKITGVRGDFSTKIMYVTSVFHSPGNIDYALNYADVDGYNNIAILRSKKPIMSPAWSPDGKKVAYVSFEGIRPAIYIQDLVSGKRKRITNFKGLNSAPAFSPDGKRMAMVLSLSGTPEIYVMELSTGRLTQVTKHYSINTSPSWMPNGQSIVFTSNRSGGPQIFSVNLESKEVQRLTFVGSYNARAKPFADGNALVMVKKGEGAAAFHVAVQNLKTGLVRVLTPETRLDDAPSISPNGTMVIYATRPAGKDRLLGMVSVDGKVSLQLPSSLGSVSEPAWSPYLTQP